MAKHFPSLSSNSTNPFGRSPRRRAKNAKKDAQSALVVLKALQERWQARPAVDWPRCALAVATTLALSALLGLHLLPDKVSLRVGQISGQEIRASRTAQYVDRAATEEMREQAASRVDPVYKPVAYAASDVGHAVDEAYALLRREHLQSAVRVAADLRQQVGVDLSPPSILTPLLHGTASAYHLDQAHRVTQQVLRDVMGGEVIRSDRPDNKAQADAMATQRLAASLLPREDVPAAAALARAIMRPNFAPDVRATEKNRDVQRGLVTPITGQVFAGEIVVRHGQPVTLSVVDKLRALGLQNPRLDLVTVGCVTLLVALMVGLVTIYLSRYQKSVYGSTKTLLLLSVLVALNVLGLKLGGTMLGVRLQDAQSGYIGVLCMEAGAMLIAALIHPRVAMLVTALLAAQAGLILGSDLRFSLMALLAGTVGIFAVSDIRSRSDVVRAGVALCVTNVLLSLLLGRIEGDAIRDQGQPALWAFLAGVFSVALFSIGADLFERLFGITTHLGLLEWSDPNRPLLQRFCQLAPGTYTHSVMVGNLAVVAAEAIGADALLCRVGAYYHDLGKMKRAEFFIENQGGGDNIHERLNPSLSALVVTAHVKEGLEIAEQERLPPVIKAFITEHHGTSLIKYFYHQHTSGDGVDAPGLEQHFRYAGPKPQSRETAILMLADSVEAASRTLEKPTPGRIADLVDRILESHLADGQLDECDLTLRDLRGIRDAFLRLLSGMLHSRIEYPELLKEPKTDKNGTADFPSDTPSALPVILADAGDAGSQSSGSAAA